MKNLPKHTARECTYAVGELGSSCSQVDILVKGGQGTGRRLHALNRLIDEVVRATEAPNCGGGLALIRDSGCALVYCRRVPRARTLVMMELTLLLSAFLGRSRHSSGKRTRTRSEERLGEHTDERRDWQEAEFRE